MTDPTKKRILVILGWVMVAVGGIGLVLPIMPTTPFLVVAAYCFSKGSPRLHRWVRQHRRFGPPLRDWEDHRVIRTKAKAIATGAIVISFGASAFFLRNESYYSLALITIAALCLLFIWTRNSESSSSSKK